jgi:hypothetical protein
VGQSAPLDMTFSLDKVNKNRLARFSRRIRVERGERGERCGREGETIPQLGGTFEMRPRPNRRSKRRFASLHLLGRFRSRGSSNAQVRAILHGQNE